MGTAEGDARGLPALSGEFADAAAAVLRAIAVLPSGTGGPGSAGAAYGAGAAYSPLVHPAGMTPRPRRAIRMRRGDRFSMEEAMVSATELP
ncbi:MAG TPA: hypothetical protein VKB14_12430, partial [Actinomycetales bacterium]|nr:hypothetical protein [Actinomycetales bacterium]